MRPVTLANMNYAVVVAAGIAVFALGWWWAGARKTYEGPRTRSILGLTAQEDGEEGDFDEGMNGGICREFDERDDGLEILR